MWWRTAYRALFLSVLIAFGITAHIISCGISGSWPDELLTVPEKTDYQQTSLYADVMSFIQALEKRSDLVHVEFIATSKGGRDIPLVVIADPPVTTPEEARQSGKPVMYFEANIHAGEVEGKEALMQIMREIALGNQKKLLENQILLFCPIYNPDGNEALNERNRPSQEHSPMLVGVRVSGEGYDLNRDAIKVEALETKGLVKNVLIKWDPVLLLDMHTTDGSWHGYSLTYAPPYTPTADPGPQGYVLNTMLPAVRKAVDKNYALDVFLYGGFPSPRRSGWPPARWTQGGYSADAWFVVNYVGLRNRMAVLSETFAHDPYKWRIRSAKAFALSIIEYTHEHGREMEDIVRKADEETVQMVRTQAGKITKSVAFGVEAFDEPIDILVYEYEAYPDTIIETNEETGKDENKVVDKYRRTDKIVTIKGVPNYNKFVSVKERPVPRGYLFPGELKNVADKLMEHGIKVSQLDAPLKVTGEEYVISTFGKSRRGRFGRQPTEISGSFHSATKVFPAGTYHIDLAQPLASLAFYMLEPEVRINLVYWTFFDDYLIKHGVEKKNIPYPVFKYYSVQ